MNKTVFLTILSVFVLSIFVSAVDDNLSSFGCPPNFTVSERHYIPPEAETTNGSVSTICRKDAFPMYNNVTINDSRVMFVVCCKPIYNYSCPIGSREVERHFYPPETGTSKCPVRTSTLEYVVADLHEDTNPPSDPNTGKWRLTLCCKPNVEEFTCAPRKFKIPVKPLVLKKAAELACKRFRGTLKWKTPSEEWCCGAKLLPAETVTDARNYAEKSAGKTCVLWSDQ